MHILDVYTNTNRKVFVDKDHMPRNGYYGLVLTPEFNFVDQTARQSEWQDRGVQVVITESRAMAIIHVCFINTTTVKKG